MSYGVYLTRVRMILIRGIISVTSPDQDSALFAPSLMRLRPNPK